MLRNTDLSATAPSMAPDEEETTALPPPNRGKKTKSESIYGCQPFHKWKTAGLQDD